MDKSVTIIGAGNIGSFVTYMLARESKIPKITVVDLDKAKVKKVKELVKRDDVDFLVGNAIEDEDVKKAICKSDVILSFLPGKIGSKIYSLAIECGVDLIDTSYIPQDPLEFDEIAKDSGITIIPDAGVAPGLSNLLAGRIYSELGHCELLAIYVGGLPKKPKPPLFHEVNWSIVDLVEEYTRPVRIIVEGKVEIVNPLTGVEEIEIDDLGRYEAFYTDGLRTMVKTLKVQNMYEKTLRYRGHLSAVRLLKELGLFSEEKINVKGYGVKPIDFTVELLKKRIYNPDLEDKLVMKVIGRKNNRSLEYIVYDEYDARTGFSAMARTTGLASISALKLLHEGKFEKGVLPLEIIGQKRELYQKFLQNYKENGVKIWERK